MNDTELKALLSRNPNHPKHGVPVPLILICNVTGKETKYTAPEYIKGKIEQAGSLEELLKNYKCKGAGGMKQGQTKKAIPTGRSWKGQEIIKSESPSGEQATLSGSDEIVHTEYHFKDGPTCNVYHPRQNSEQPASRKYTFG